MTYLMIFTLLCLAIAAGTHFLIERNLLRTIIFAAATVIIINPLVYTVGMKIAMTDATTFNEYWNGYEASADSRDVTCTRDGSCANEYKCDPYTVPVTKTRTVSDGNGGTRTETYVDIETRYHDCPYSTKETTYTVSTTLGDKYNVEKNLMTGGPWRPGKAIPGGQVTTVPERWLQVKERIDAGAPGPVTKVSSYTNYILASTQTIFRKYEGDIETLNATGLLPMPASGITDIYHATKSYNVSSVLPANKAAEYATDVAYLNGAVGSDLRGDLHVVFVPKDIALGPDNYSAALVAYWQSDLMGKNAVSKNAIVVVIGVDGNEVAWARGATGMPIGNEGLIMDIQSDLKGATLDRDLLGRPSMNLAKEEIKHTDGLLENTLWGPNTYERVSMSGDGDESAGFGYLMSDVKVGAGTYWMIAIVNLLFIAGAGVAVLYFTTPENSR